MSPPPRSGHQSFSHHIPMNLTSPDPEQESLLSDHDNEHDRNTHQTPPSSRWRAAHPYWLLPVIVVASMARGMTLAPRIQVYNHIACQAILNPSHSQPPPTLAECSASSDAQARAAQIQASVITIMSILSAVTTGLWSRFGDLHGRKIVFTLTILGSIAMDIVVILVAIATPGSLFSRHGEGLILLGPIVDGLSGGLSTFNGVIHAYTSDCTAHGSRSKIFSTLQGIVFIGLSLGPILGNAGLHLFPIPNAPSNPTDKSLAESAFLFYTSVALQFALLAFVLFLLPESLQPQPNPTHPRHASTDSARSGRGRKKGWRKRLQKFLAVLVSPITMFRPRVVAVTGGRKMRKTMDWNLTFLGIGLFTYLLSIGLYQVKYMYAKHVYHWSAAQLGFYMSLLWTSRAVNLLVVLPLIISYFKPKSTTSPTSPSQNSPHISSDLAFDKRLAQTSLTVDGLADFLVFLAPTANQPLFIMLSCLNSFTSGGNPAMHSLGAVCLHAMGRGEEVGTLFGALAVLSAGAHAFSPTIYAFTYARTVATLPKAIFLLGAGFLAAVVFCLSAINPHRHHPAQASEGARLSQSGEIDDAMEEADVEPEG